MKKHLVSLNEQLVLDFNGIYEMNSLKDVSMHILSLFSIGYLMMMNILRILVGNARNGYY